MTVAVIDVGKTNIKLTAADPDGRLLETLTAANPVRPGPPYRHHDLGATEDWIAEGLAALGRRHAVDAIVPCAHGSGGVLVGPQRVAMPMVDYEQPVPPAVEAEYRRAAGSFRERGSPFMLGATHLARQMLWIETAWPAAFARASFFLAAPQYWAWRLSGVAAGEVTSLAAQSHLWCPTDRRPALMVGARGWDRLMPPLRPAWDTLGTLRPDWVARTGLPPATRVVNGIHDSSANLYRYQAAGLSNLTVVSTGTWMVAIGDAPHPDPDTERPGVCCNADVHGEPLAGVLTMAGREFGAVAGVGAAGAADLDRLGALVATGTTALPSFGPDDTLFPGTAGTGTVAGSLADSAAHRPSLAVLYAALLTDACLDGLALGRTLVLDGPFVRDPLYGALMAAFRPDARVVVNHDLYGTATGCALLAGHAARIRPAPLKLDEPRPVSLPGLLAYRTAWRRSAQQRSHP